LRIRGSGDGGATTSLDEDRYHGEHREGNTLIHDGALRQCKHNEHRENSLKHVFVRTSKEALRVSVPELLLFKHQSFAAWFVGAMNETLPGFHAYPFTYEGTTRTVFRLGTGPGVIIMTEVPGITPQVKRFAERVAAEGFTVFLPHLFGEPGLTFSYGASVVQITRACIRREFDVFASRASSPITTYLRALCRSVHAELGGKGVGAIGMCLTGNFALSLMVDPVVMAPVLSQPSLPAPLGRERRAALHVSDEDLAVIKRRTAEGVTVLGMRFTGDPLCPGERFARLRHELGDGFEGIEIDSSPGNAHGIKRTAHSVVTTDLVDEAGHPTRVALDRVLALFRERLLP
jgi:dienelactone hydrolase